jgi:dCMP deaminase
MLSKWDNRFMRLAMEVSRWSKDPSTQTGAVLVSPDKTDIVLGYNGFPARMKDDAESYANREKKYSKILHCESNAVILARRSVAGYTLYTYPFLSCDRCAVTMIQAGIVRAVAPKPTAEQASRWENLLVKTREYFTEAGVEILEFEREELEDVK